jgi:hypothetical protein
MPENLIDYQKRVSEEFFEPLGVYLLLGSSRVMPENLKSRWVYILLGSSRVMPEKFNIQSCLEGV